MEDRCIEGLELIPDSLRACVLTIGNFDGVHLGHRRILARAGALADAEAAPVVAMTFEPPPYAVLRPDRPAQRISTPAQRAELLRQAGAEHVVVARADRTLLEMTPDEFIRRVVVRRLAPSHVVEGPDFFFGRRRSGTIETLRAAGEAAGFLLHVVEPAIVELAGGRAEQVSSTLIRQLLLSGDVAGAARCLGRPFALAGTVVPGSGRGRRLDHPTTNLATGDQVCPADGVYAGRADVAGAEFPAAISIGAKPTFAGEARTVEAHLIGASGDYYGRAMVLRFLRRLRGQVRFDDAEALRAQMRKDVQRVREICE